MVNTYTILLLLSIVLFSCKKKEETYSLNGMVSDVVTGYPVSGATVEIQGKLINSSTYSSMFSSFATVTSSSDGSYTCEFEKQKVTAFKLIVSYNGYKISETEFSPDLIESGTYSLNVQIAANAWIAVHVVNVAPANEDDMYTYRFLNMPSVITGTCGSGVQTFNGIVDQEIEACFVPGKLNLIIEKVYNYQSTHIQSFDTIYMVPSDTTQIILQY